MAKISNRINVLDFVISVLTRHEKELDRNLAKLERITRKLEGSDNGQTAEGVLLSNLKQPSKRSERKPKAKSKATLRQCT